jgi:hypothetical protein
VRFLTWQTSSTFFCFVLFVRNHWRNTALAKSPTKSGTMAPGSTTGATALRATIPVTARAIERPRDATRLGLIPQPTTLGLALAADELQVARVKQTTLQDARETHGSGAVIIMFARRVMIRALLQMSPKK